VTNNVQRITNCVLWDQDRQRILLLRKPKRGWWVAPGGKMEPGETVEESVNREFWEETGLRLSEPQLRGVFTILIEDGGEVREEWMMFTFLATRYTGELLQHSPEGTLRWVSAGDIAGLPKAEGDQIYFNHILHRQELLIKKFRYTPDYVLLGHE
jgi:8-oxo-dGTP diphosphatase